MAQIRYSADASICIVEEDDGTFRVVTQEDIDTLPMGNNLTEEEIELLDN